jgi:hypothetical protein
MTILGQTYQGRKTSLEKKKKLPEAKYVNVTKAFNPHLAPSDEILSEYKANGETEAAWKVFKAKFLEKILADSTALDKIDKFLFDSLSKDVVLVCFESEEHYGNHCHRFLLLDIAENRAKEKGIPVEIRRENYLQE